MPSSSSRAFLGCGMTSSCTLVLVVSVQIVLFASTKAFQLGSVNVGQNVRQTARRSGISTLEMQRTGSRIGSVRPPTKKPEVLKEELLGGKKVSQFWVNPFPLKPYTPSRDTTVKRVGDDIVLFEQEHGFANVSVNIRMTVVKLQDGGLWVHAPIAPTAEVLHMVKSLGEVKHIILPTSGLEHKLFVGSFCAQFPAAKVWVSPGQWSWPIDLPLPFRVDGVLQNEDMNTPWASEIEQKVLYAEVGIGKCSEVAFFHKRSKSLLCTDAVIYISKNAPEVVAAMVEEGNNKWERTALMACFLGPPNNVDAFEAISEKLFVSPVVRTFIYERTREETKAWVDSIVEWNFKSIIPAHLEAPIQASPKEFKNAFRFLDDPNQNLLPENDMKPLNAISKLLTIAGLIPPRAFGE